MIRDLWIVSGGLWLGVEKQTDHRDSYADHFGLRKPVGR